MRASQRPRTDEEAQAKIPALSLLLKLGWTYLSQAECLAGRGNERAVLMEGVLKDWLSAYHFTYRGQAHPLSPSGIAQVTKAVNETGLSEGLTPANERTTKRLAFGITVTEFMPDGHRHAVTVPLLDFNTLDQQL